MTLHANPIFWDRTACMRVPNRACFDTFWRCTSADASCCDVQDSNSTSFIVRLYYSNRMFMGFCCVSAEVILLCMFAVCNEVPLAALGAAPAWATGASSLMTGQCNAAMQPDVAAVAVLILCLPGCIVKQCINVYQLTTAAQQVARLDEAKTD